MVSLLRSGSVALEDTRRRIRLEVERTVPGLSFKDDADVIEWWDDNGFQGTIRPTRSAADPDLRAVWDSPVGGIIERIRQLANQPNEEEAQERIGTEIARLVGFLDDGSAAVETPLGNELTTSSRIIGFLNEIRRAGDETAPQLTSSSRAEKWWRDSGSTGILEVRDGSLRWRSRPDWLEDRVKAGKASHDDLSELILWLQAPDQRAALLQPEAGSPSKGYAWPLDDLGLESTLRESEARRIKSTLRGFVGILEESANDWPRWWATIGYFGHVADGQWQSPIAAWTDRVRDHGSVDALERVLAVAEAHQDPDRPEIGRHTSELQSPVPLS